jgi:hypothetical protein
MCLLVDRAQHVAGLGDLRQVDLCLDLVLGASGPRLTRPGGRFLAGKILPHPLRFVDFD